ncbi:hypothetical protein B296_00033462 [Ensete ventricosum]|uniref:Uncharacterized protein n=1 Tax=Ensete ventricosum TaxID=4639 RepID=A0A426XEY5_ENSVE|nr:hypothetical protein B296_00033462 [Ensete ventricosum]
MAEALRCVGRGHTWRSRSPSSSHENLYVMEMSLGGDMVQRIVVRIVRGNVNRRLCSMRDKIMRRYDQELWELHFGVRHNKKKGCGFKE